MKERKRAWPAPWEKICGSIYRFYGRLSIRGKLLISCLPFVIIGYILIFYGVTVLMFDQMKQTVYDQTKQNILEKRNLINTSLNNYNQATIKFLYYTDEVQEYLNTRQSGLSEQERKELTNRISHNISSLIINNQTTITNVCLYNRFGELYINNAIYKDTIAQTNEYGQMLQEIAQQKHGKLIISKNPIRKNVITFARNIFVLDIARCDEKIGFLMLDIDKANFEKIIRTRGDGGAVSLLVLDAEDNILLNGSEMTDSDCREILKNPSANYLIYQYEIQYGDCRLVGIVDEQMIFQDTYRIFLQEMLMILTAILIIVAALFLSATGISGQVQKFIVKLRQTKEINQSAYVEVDSSDEFRELADVYNDMLDRIDTLIQQVYKQQILMKDAQIETLEAQINPHFLYNTLDCINSLADAGRIREVKKTVTSLGGIMRMAIKGSSFLRIREELDYVTQYLYIQKMRFQERIIFLVEIPEELYEYYIPKLVIQPLLENAILHGVSVRKDTGMIAVTGTEDETSVYLTVKDNGIGMPQQIIGQLKVMGKDSFSEEKKHIGIFNIQQRLRLLYGEEYGLTIELLKPSGTAVTIRIPKIREEAACENLNCG